MCQEIGQPTRVRKSIRGDPPTIVQTRQERGEQQAPQGSRSCSEALAGSAGGERSGPSRSSPGSPPRRSYLPAAVRSVPCTTDGVEPNILTRLQGKDLCAEGARQGLHGHVHDITSCIPEEAFPLQGSRSAGSEASLPSASWEQQVAYTEGLGRRTGGSQNQGLQPNNEAETQRK